MQDKLKVIDPNKIDVVFDPKFGKVYNIKWNNVVIGELEFDGDKNYYVLFKSDFIKEMNNSIPFKMHFSASLSISIDKQLKNYVIDYYNNSLNKIKVAVMAEDSIVNFEYKDLKYHGTHLIYDRELIDNEGMYYIGFDTKEEFLDMIKILFHNDHVQLIQRSSIASRDYVLCLKGSNK